jgi:hypothetical protein
MLVPKPAVTRSALAFIVLAYAVNAFWGGKTPLPRKPPEINKTCDPYKRQTEKHEGIACVVNDDTHEQGTQEHAEVGNSIESCYHGRRR